MSDYYIWLLERIDLTQESDSRLLRHLFYKPFTYILPMDSNRAMGGENLRSVFAYENGIYLEDVYIGKCSVLECLVALALHMNDYDATKTPNEYFTKMLRNLDILGDYDEEAIDKKLDRWMMRQYDSDGRGSIYYIQGITEDLRNMEIWDQMIAFLNSQK